ncbi:MAG: alpha/beta hydrolase [Burkholderiales bacterium]|jgi:pimeloyl-ACP methyl ester carboxylesterase|nr:alpha/beta hydrolase [Burkholderiales bacterium]
MITAAKTNPALQPVHALKAQINACLTHDSLASLPRITAHTLVITGAEDLVMTPQISEELKNKISNAELVVIEIPRI